MNPRVLIVRPGDMPYTVEKRPDERLDFAFDWSREIAGDPIASSSWQVGDGLTQPYAASNTDTEAKVWLAGGSVGQQVRVINRITTTGNRTLIRSFLVNVVSP